MSMIMTFAAVAGAPAAIYRLSNKSSTSKMKRIAVGALVMPFLTYQAFLLASEMATGDVFMSLIGAVPVLAMLFFLLVCC